MFCFCFTEEPSTGAALAPTFLSSQPVGMEEKRDTGHLQSHMTPNTQMQTVQKTESLEPLAWLCFTDSLFLLIFPRKSCQPHGLVVTPIIVSHCEQLDKGRLLS